MTDVKGLDERTRTELEAAAFRTLVEHFRAHPEVQNIDLMNLAGFCRNCLSKWYRAAAEERGLAMSYDQAREIVYGMPYERVEGAAIRRRRRRAEGALRRARRSAPLSFARGSPRRAAARSRSPGRGGAPRTASSRHSAPG